MIARAIDGLAAMAVSLALLLPHVGGWEGRVFPVAGLEITRTEPVGESATRIWGVVNKMRDCEVTGLDWWQGRPWASAYAATTSETSVIDRPEGYTPFGPFIVHLPPARALQSSVTARFHCHALWTTETIIYNGT